MTLRMLPPASLKRRANKSKSRFVERGSNGTETVVTPGQDDVLCIIMRIYELLTEMVAVESFIGIRNVALVIRVSIGDKYGEVRNSALGCWDKPDIYRSTREMKQFLCQHHERVNAGSGVRVLKRRRRLSSFLVHTKAQFTQDAEHLTTGVCKFWNTLSVFTQVASNIRGFAPKFTCKSANASCVNGA